MKNDKQHKSAASEGADYDIVRIPVEKHSQDVSVADLLWIQRELATPSSVLNKRQAQLIDACISFTISNASVSKATGSLRTLSTQCQQCGAECGSVPIKHGQKALLHCECGAMVFADIQKGDQHA